MDAGLEMRKITQMVSSGSVQDHRHSGLSVHADTPVIVAASAGVFIPSE